MKEIYLAKKSIYELKRAFSCVVTKDLKPHLKYAYDGLFLKNRCLQPQTIIIQEKNMLFLFMTPKASDYYLYCCPS